VTDKLSKVYVEAPIRQADKTPDIELMDNLTDIMQANTILAQSNKLMNAQKSCAIEPYLDGREQRLRVIPNHKFLPFSDDPTNPLKMTVFIKLLGSTTVTDHTTTQRDGTNNEQLKSNIRTINIYQAFSDTQVMIFNSDGNIEVKMMQQFGIADMKNEFGVIPQTYINTSSNMLIPYANQSGFDMSILIPKLLTDLNYAVQFLSHSILWVKNANLEEQELNPDVVLDLGEGGGAGDTQGEPEIGTIDPTVQIEEQLQLIQFQFAGYLSSVGIKSSNVGSMMPGREASGFAKAMDEGDSTAVRKEQSELYRHVEKQLWNKIQMAQKIWSTKGLVNESRQFSDSFKDSFSVKFAEMKILKTDKEKIDEAKMLRDMGLMTPKQAIKFLKPDFTDSQVNQWVAELEAQEKKDLEMQLPNTGHLDDTNTGHVKPARDKAKEQRKETLGN